ncbi:MAG: biotin/lipoyl-binding protein [Lachnospiraceae bacterium]|nr:biotin/lipoyl-binding protein [Lachnospiraceae bacterium]
MKKSAVFLSLLLSASLLFGCSGKTEGEASVQSISMICGIGSTGLADRFAGVVSPKSETSIKKNEEQTVSEVKVKAGDKVKKGQVLFTYDEEQTQLDLEKAQLELDQLKNSREAQKQEKASLEKERASASQDQKLSYTLEIQEAETAILEADYNISTKEKEVEKLKKTLKNLTVKSPVNGQIQTINEEGASDSNGNPLPYITIVETSSYRVKGYVNETNAQALAEGTAVLLRSRVDDTVWHGTISSIDWENPEQAGGSDYIYGGAADSTTTSSRYPFYVKLEDDKNLMLGQHVYIEPDYGQEDNEASDALELPSVYINDTDSSPWVWAQNDKNLLEKRSITLGEYNADMDTWPVTDGLTADDYIAFPDDSLQEGMTCVTYDENSFSDGSQPVENIEGNSNMDSMDNAAGNEAADSAAGSADSVGDGSSDSNGGGM